MTRIDTTTNKGIAWLTNDNETNVYTKMEIVDLKKELFKEIVKTIDRELDSADDLYNKAIGDYDIGYCDGVVDALENIMDMLKNDNPLLF